MKNLKIGIKLITTFMLIILLFCITVAAAMYGLRENAERYSEFYNVDYQVSNKVMEMRRGLQIIVKDLSFITIAGDDEKSAGYLSDLQKELALLEENATWLFGNFTGDQALLDAFAGDVTQAVDMQQAVLDMVGEDTAKAQDLLLDEYQPLVEEAVESLIQISNASEEGARASFLKTSELQELLEYALLALAGGALVITIIVSLYLTGSITKPLHQLEASARKIVEGDFKISVSYKSKDELGCLAEAFRNMTAILETVIEDASMILSEMADGNFDVRTRAEERYVGSFQNLLTSIRRLNRDMSITLGQINQSADQVSSGSSQVSDGAQALAQGATEQASAVEELAATIAGISRQVKETAENAAEARRQSSNAGGEVEECNRQMRDMMSAMEEIARTSNQISKIIKTIEDIAFQTNILALNASVEASRAGAAGKGFSVVADEVRTLASKSSEASKNTAELIESSIEAVARGTQIADTTAQFLSKVVEEVHVAADKVDMIADAATEQAGAVEQVTMGVDQISSVVQTNSATAQESAAASQELSSQADMLKNLVAKFNLRAEYASGNAGGYGNSYRNDAYNSISLD